VAAAKAQIFATLFWKELIPMQYGIETKYLRPISSFQVTSRHHFEGSGVRPLRYLRRSAISKTDARYWKGRIRKQEKSSNWSVEICVAGQRHKWSLDTPNKESAATRARGIYVSIKGNGWEGTLQKYRPALASPQKRQNATVGEFLNEVKAKAAV
jgi:hypothetical protein